MTTATTKKLKGILDRLGLLPVAQAAHAQVNRLDVAGFRRGLKYYLYNHWLTNFPSNTIRLEYLRRVLDVDVGKGVFVHMGCFFEGDRISIGDNTVIGRRCYLSGGALTIKDNVSITAYSYIFTSTHQVNSPEFAVEYKDVLIDDHAWIGAGAMIMPGVRIGKGAVLGAAAAATKDVPDFTIHAGVPAREIGKRNPALDYALSYRPYFQ